MSNYFVFIVKNATIDDIIINVITIVKKNNLNKQIICVAYTIRGYGIDSCSFSRASISVSVMFNRSDRISLVC